MKKKPQINKIVLYTYYTIILKIMYFLNFYIYLKFMENKIAPPHITNKIKTTCEYVYQNSKLVKINEEKIKEFISKNVGSLSPPSWTSSHFNPNDFPIELSLAFTFVIDSLNFCFWPFEKVSNIDFEYGEMVNNLLKTLKTKPEFFMPENLKILTTDELCDHVFINPKFPLLIERTRSLNELGDFISSNFQNSYLNFLEKCEFNCVNIVKKISEGVTTYRDETIFKGKQIFIYKRAQILAADLFYMLKELNNPILLTNACELTMFADYRVPQILLELGVMEYDQTLLTKILNKEEIAPNSQEEIEIRANTIIAVEKIKQELNSKSDKSSHLESNSVKSEIKNYLSLEVDYILWNIGEEKRKELKPHHRTLTIFY